MPGNLKDQKCAEVILERPPKQPMDELLLLFQKVIVKISLYKTRNSNLKTR